MKRTAIFAVFVMVLGGCATVPVSWQEDLKSYPMIELGQTPPADGKYVVHLPAGKPVEVMRVILEGDLFASETVQEVRVTPRRDIYLYESWMSFDMQSWKKTKASLSRKWDFTMPSHKNPKAGHIKIILDEKKE
jgi:hypothetical protein